MESGWSNHAKYHGDIGRDVPCDGNECRWLHGLLFGHHRDGKFRSDSHDHRGRTNDLCQGGSVTLTASAGSSYLWSPAGQTSQSITVSAAGSYAVTVTNASGCSATSAATTVSVTQQGTASITASGPTTFCQGGSVTLNASSGTSYLWSPGGETTPSISVSNAGSYSVTVTGTGGCTGTSSPTTVTVNALPVPTVSAGGPTTFCQGDQVVPISASGGTSYVWSPGGATTNSITVTASGNYSVTATNASGCPAVSNGTAVTVNGAPTAAITANGPTTFCQGGSVTLTASAGTSYLWSPGGETTQSITVGSAGSYSVTVTNAAGVPLLPVLKSLPFPRPASPRLRPAARWPFVTAVRLF